MTPSPKSRLTSPFTLVPPIRVALSESHRSSPGLGERSRECEPLRPQDHHCAERLLGAEPLEEVDLTLAMRAAHAPEEVHIDRLRGGAGRRREPEDDHASPRSKRPRHAHVIRCRSRGTPCGAAAEALSATLASGRPVSGLAPRRGRCRRRSNGGDQLLVILERYAGRPAPPHVELAELEDGKALAAQPGREVGGHQPPLVDLGFARRHLGPRDEAACRQPAHGLPAAGEYVLFDVFPDGAHGSGPPGLTIRPDASVRLDLPQTAQLAPQRTCMPGPLEATAVGLTRVNPPRGGWAISIQCPVTGSISRTGRTSGCADSARARPKPSRRRRLP